MTTHSTLLKRKPKREAFHEQRGVVSGVTWASLPKSSFLPELDLDLLTHFIDCDDQTETIVAYRDRLRGAE